MTDVFSKEKRSEIMRNIKSEKTKPELIVQKFLFSHGFRYRLHKKDLPGRPDIVLPKYCTVILVHGCFWHGHNCKIGSGLKKPKSNTDYWLPKIARNIARDEENEKNLKEVGWRVITLWECEIIKGEGFIKKLQPLLEMKDSLNNKYCKWD